MKTLLLIDGNAIIHRAYHALPPLTSRQGLPTNAIYGFFAMLHKVILDFHPQYLVVCFDTPKQTFRQKMFKEYQANRPAASDDFKVQIPYIFQLLDAAGIVRMQKDGYEADDVIGTLATKYKSNDTKVLILTGDKDIMQLVDKNVSVISPQTGISTTVMYTPDEVRKKLNVAPEQIADYKALAGDPSDNYKGVPGIGPKTAAKLVNEYGSVENLVKQIDKMPEDKLKKSLQENKENITTTKKLATIVTSLDFDMKLDQFIFTSFKPEMKAQLEQLQLYSMLKRFFPNEQKQEKKTVQVKKNVGKSQPGLFS